MLTKQRAYQLVNELRDAVHQWDAWECPAEHRMLYNGQGVKPIGESLKQKIVEIGEAFRTSDIEMPAWELALKVDDFFSEFSRWLVDMSIAPDAIHPSGTPELWETYRAVLKVADTRRPPAPPPAHVLVTQGATARTIAQRYGWYTDGGRPDIERVNQELAARPEDREYDPKTWMHPRERQFLSEIKTEWDKRCEKFESQAASERPPKSERQPCKESWEELFEYPYMRLEQIAMMKLVSVEEVRAKADELGYVKCAEGFRRANEYTRRGDNDPSWLTRHDPHDEFGDDIDKRIIACYEDGLKRAKYIADLLSGSRNLGVTVQKVAQVIRRYKEEQEVPAA